jgi:hypothetical protein
VKAEADRRQLIGMLRASASKWSEEELLQLD